MSLCSLIILTFNALKYTKECFESIVHYTVPQYEIIFVDNGSTDGTLSYLQNLPGRITVIKNKINQGFAKGCNQGAALAKGDTLLFLNNDTIVTSKWLDNLLHCLNSNSKIGSVTPCSNFAAGASQIDVWYRTINDMQQFAQQFNVSNPQKWIETNSASGFCLLTKKKLFQSLGGFDEQYAVGGYEDIDLTFRIFTAGYKVIVAQDTFIHHFGNSTYKANRIDISRFMEENSEKFNRKFIKWKKR